ncbi:MAG: DNA polymerase domain-containing protein [Methanobacteriaceae archaeon]|nr:DNA polymerase domain-containing protein [Methanobacteriaceae archaeon]
MVCSLQNELEAKIQSQKDKFLEFINQDLPEGMELEYEGFYKRGFFVTKKRYALIENEKIVAKGLELVRRDWAPIAKDTQQDILMAILKDGSPEKAREIIKNVIIDIKSGEVAMKDMVIHTQITKKLSDYKQIGPHVVAAQRSIAKGRKIERGSIIRYVIVKGKSPISKRAFPIEDTEKMEYDPEYYLKNQVLPAVSRIMDSLGYSSEKLAELAQKEKQSSLDAFF